MRCQGSVPSMCLVYSVDGKFMSLVVSTTQLNTTTPVNTPRKTSQSDLPIPRRP